MLFFPPPWGKCLLADNRKNLEDKVANTMSEMITAKEKRTSCFDIGQPIEESGKKLRKIAHINNSDSNCKIVSQYSSLLFFESMVKKKVTLLLTRSCPV